MSSMLKFSELSLTQKIGILAAGTAVLGGSIYAWRRYKNNNPSPKDFKEVAKVSKLIIYPVKSLPGVEITNAEITKCGLKHGVIQDRQWVITTKDGGFITQRQHPLLALISVYIDKDEVHLNAQDLPPLRLKFQTEIPPGQNPKTINLYTQDIQCLDCGDEAAAWIQKYLKLDNVRFGQYLPNFAPRKMLRNLLKFPNPGGVMYHDDSAVTILSVNSVNDLNSRLAPEDKVSYRNFRPSILIDNCGAYEEDDFKFVDIGTSKLVYMEPCTRCILTTVNPETGIKNLYEPLRTLRKYRMSKDKENRKRFGNGKESLHAMKSPRFAIYLGVREEGSLAIGDIVNAVC